MGQESNPFYVQPANYDTAPVMSGINQVLETTRVLNKKKQMKEKMLGAFQSGNPDQVAEFIAEFPEAQAGLSSAMGFKSAQTKKNYLDTMRSVLSTSDLYEDSPERDEKIIAMLEARNEYVRGQGGDPVDTEKAIEEFKRDPNGFIERTRLGYAGMAPKEEWEAYKTLAMGGDVDPKFLEEERKTASQDVRAFNTKAREMRTSYGQLSGLADQARTGDRGARNAMMVTLARLISPGIVTEKEAGALAGGQNSMQFVVEALLSSKDKEGSAKFANVLKGFDPYGESFDADAVLKIGESVVASGRQPLIDMYEGSRSRAQRAKMGQTAFHTNFGDNENYDFLKNFGGAGGVTGDEAQDMGGQPAPDQAPAQAPAWPTKYQQGRGTSPIPPNMAQINLVKERPDLAELFLNKYGYLPEGVTPQQGGM